jgi:uncharacterized protein (AIM24 family)
MFFIGGIIAMIRYSNVFDNSNMLLIEQDGAYFVYEHQMDRSNSAMSAANAYFMREMNVKKRQVLVQLNGTAVRMQAGAMQWMTGNISMRTGLNVGNFIGKAIKAKVTGESLTKPIYEGAGCIMLEPTYNHILIENVANWGPAGVVLDDGLFLACDESVEEKVVARTNLSSAVFGGEGLFNLSLRGQGFAALESPVPREELFVFDLDNDVLKIDGNMAIAWSASLNFSVEKTSKSLIGSAISKEGLVNVYRGTGRVMMAPTLPGALNMFDHNGPEQTTSNAHPLSSLGN